MIYATFITENLSIKNTTNVSQSSTYNYTKGNKHIYRNATNANDGEFGTREADCAHTAPGHDKAWFQVDLGSTYSLKSIIITYRDEGETWKPYRFRQFYLDVANVSESNSLKTGRFRCYTDNTTNSSVPPNVIHIPCKQAARYVIVETIYDAPEDEITGAILELCEIEIYVLSASINSVLKVMVIVIIEGVKQAITETNVIGLVLTVLERTVLVKEESAPRAA
ncbi:uncharacterized protein LOC133193115 [Saccostrea echinata]|uniref:uncharacterized protein LOC133193115 n=1 Tax=Saccostrea echinata TaxID=191078 RepID=UPI002A7ECC19|nr:uncharacterized protein LOC133193115 [Saccostrea echinata]